MRKVIVNWETDGYEANLPTTIQLPDNILDDEVADWLSDNYGYLVESWFYDY